MNYIKKTFKDKKVIKALIIVAISLVIAIVGYYLPKQKLFKFIFLFAGTILMFMQFPTISNTAMKYAEEEEAEERAAKQSKMHPGKK